MPHIPRSATPSLASTTSPIAPELVHGEADEKKRRLKTSHSPMEQDKQKSQFGLPTISITNYQVPPDRIFEQLFGKKLDINERTGIANMVS